ncbi:MAG: hypothetical protein ACC645_01695 [Pirellulales bacterium]
MSRFSLLPRGASFQADERSLLIGRRRARPVGLAVGPGGRVFGTILHMAHLESSPATMSDLVMITTADDPTTHPIDAYDAPSAPAEKLWAELSSASWSRRRQAHVELLRRGGPVLAEALRRLDHVGPNDPAIDHLPWLAAAQGDALAIERLSARARHLNAGVRLQSVRALTELVGRGAPATIFTEVLADADPQVRHAALVASFELDGPLPKQQVLELARSEPLVAKVVVASEKQRLAALPVSEIKTITKAWITGPFPDGPDGLETVHPPEQGAINLAARYSAGHAKRTWRQTSGRYFDFDRLLGSHDNTSVYAYCRLQSPRQQRILLFVGSNDGVKVWHNRRPVWKNDVVRRALAFQDPVLLDLQPGSNDLLVKVHNATGASGMYLSFKALGPVVATLPEKLAFDTLAQRLKAAGGTGNTTTISVEFLSVDWREAARQGDPERGRKLFSPDGLACAKCHAIGPGEQGGGGPSLAEAGKRFTVPHLVESILLPSKNVSPVFRSTQIITTDGRQVSGLVVSETADKIELLLSDTTRTTIQKSDIEASKAQDISPMPQGVVKKPAELGDLLAYLLSDQP